MILVGPGEGAAFVSEQFAGDQLFGKDSAVKGHKTLFSTRAEFVDGSSDQFLARTSFTLDQDIAVKLRTWLIVSRSA